MHLVTLTHVLPAALIGPTHDNDAVLASLLLEHDDRSASRARDLLAVVQLDAPGGELVKEELSIPVFPNLTDEVCGGAR